MNRTPRGGLATALAAMLWLTTAPLLSIPGLAQLQMQECYYPSVDHWGPCGAPGPPGNPYTPPGGVTPPSGACPDLTQAWFYGFVVDPYARGVASARVTASGSFNGKSFLNAATTLANGAFAVCVPAGEQTVNLAAQSPAATPTTFEPASEVYTLNPQNPTYPDMMLIWTLRIASVSPQWEVGFGQAPSSNSTNTAGDDSKLSASLTNTTQDNNELLRAIYELSQVTPVGTTTLAISRTFQMT